VGVKFHGHHRNPRNFTLKPFGGKGDRKETQNHVFLEMTNVTAQAWFINGLNLTLVPFFWGKGRHCS